MTTRNKSSKDGKNRRKNDDSPSQAVALEEAVAAASEDLPGDVSEQSVDTKTVAGSLDAEVTTDNDSAVSAGSDVAEKAEADFGGDEKMAGRATKTIRVAETVDPALALGELLRQARENRFYSLGEISDNLKFSVHRIDALERGDYTDLPEPVFVKGFVRTYARFVGVSDIQIHHYLAQIFPDEQNAPLVSALEAKPLKKGYLNYLGKPVKRRVPKWGQGLFLLLVIVAAVYLWQNKSSQENVETTITPVNASVPALETDNIRLVPMDELVETAESASEPDLDGVASDADTAEAETLPIQTLLINLQHPSWLKVDDARGETLYSQTAESGISLRFDGVAPYQVRIGNPSGVSMVFDGREIPVANSGKPITLTIANPEE